MSVKYLIYSNARSSKIDRNWDFPGNIWKHLANPVSIGVAEKHDFCGIERKIPHESNFADNRDMNPFPHGETAADLAKSS
jgi:hypothetical protein